ncbi:phosphoesterase [Nocardiopsis kunsanensis]|uniref:Phosphoesterase n=1 Tax=Nocardiopsis kunsanensis TaxID=141693 RepID=A0A919CJ58_9ACTN|nr:metallophosphoesterase family protein [Nocardiopsis kunsanensis]GHD29205.1 phosphoesterase [Nocardiopsis kunsanensis]
MHAPTAAALRRISAALSGIAVATALFLTVPYALAGPPDRLLLSPTADPATSQTVTWRTPTSTTADLQITPHHTTEQVTTVSATSTGQAHGTFHTATATDLEPDTAYRYRVSDNTGRTSPWHTFTTATPEPRPFTFLSFGDLQTHITEGAGPVVEAALAAEPDADLAVHAGDLVDDANNENQWEQWYEVFGDSTATMNHLTTPGNHEYTLLRLSQYWPLQFPGPDNGPDTGGTDLAATLGHTDHQGVRFITLNSNYREAAPLTPHQWLHQQAQWLEHTLETNPHPWTVVTFHHPLFSNLPDRDKAPLRRAWLPILEEHDVDLVLQGHDHSYSRGNLTRHRTDDQDVHTGPVYAVTVTGPKMYEATTENWTDNNAEARVQQANTQTFQSVHVDRGTLSYTARTASGQTVDAFTITKDPQGGNKRVTDQVETD